MTPGLAKLPVANAVAEQGVPEGDLCQESWARTHLWAPGTRSRPLCATLEGHRWDFIPLWGAQWL